MKKHALQTASLWLLVTLALTSAYGQSITVKVPFEFLVSDKVFPGGRYSVSSTRDHLTVHDSTGKAVFTAIANSVSGRHTGATGQIVFHCYGDRCFLSELWTPTRDNGSQLLPSRYEKEFARLGKGTEFALLEEHQK